MKEQNREMIKMGDAAETLCEDWTKRDLFSGVYYESVYVSDCSAAGAGEKIETVGLQNESD